jgi:hypothetical protein
MLLMHKLFTVLVFGSECRWPVKLGDAVNGRCSGKPPTDAQNQAARDACFGALVWRDQLLLVVSSVCTAICRCSWYWSQISHTSHSSITLLLESAESVRIDQKSGCRACSIALRHPCRWSENYLDLGNAAIASLFSCCACCAAPL